MKTIMLLYSNPRGLNLYGLLQNFCHGKICQMCDLVETLNKLYNKCYRTSMFNVQNSTLNCIAYICDRYVDINKGIYKRS